MKMQIHKPCASIKLATSVLHDGSTNLHRHKQGSTIYSFPRRALVNSEFYKAGRTCQHKMQYEKQILASVQINLG